MGSTDHTVPRAGEWTPGFHLLLPSTLGLHRSRRGGRHEESVRGIQGKPPPSPSTQDPFPRWRVGLDKDLLVETHTPPGCRQLSETGRHALVSATAGPKGRRATRIMVETDEQPPTGGRSAHFSQEFWLKSLCQWGSIHLPEHANEAGKEGTRHRAGSVGNKGMPAGAWGHGWVAETKARASCVTSKATNV